MSLRSGVQSLLKVAGLRLVREEHARPLMSFFAMLKQQGFQPKLIYDVGANHGTWTRCALNYFPEASYTLIEPQDHLKSSIEDLIRKGFKIEWIHAGVGSEPGTQLFHIADQDQGSSFVFESSGTAPSPDQVEVKVTTLNQLLSRPPGLMPDLVKIDAEGWDFKVLEGASDLIGKTDIFLIEAAVCARNMENTVLSVLQKFDRRGYTLIDITELNRSPANRALWLTELAFLRRESPLLDRVKSFE